MSELYTAENSADAVPAELAPSLDDAHLGEAPAEPEAPDDATEPDGLIESDDRTELDLPTEPDSPAEPVEPGEGELPESAETDAPKEGPPREFESNAEGAEYGRETWGEAQEKLTPEQYEALHGYTGEKYPGEVAPPDYKEINGSLRGYAESSSEVEESISLMDQAMELQPTPESVKVLRETGLNSFNCPVEHLKGSIQQDRGYLSTALGPEPTFAPEKEVVLHLDIPEGTPAMYMEGLSHYDSERELLLGRGVEYLVDDVEHDGDRWHVYGSVLPRSSDRPDQ
ncbi:ADP-ribosyltransferase [Streptomyces avermitilis]|uniref:ADP-ribosyltransferase n=1 Tax=Streptomyces avermitilis TaxID=33903 RepID=UPI003816069F